MMKIVDLQNKNIAVLGVGVEGLSSAVYLAQKGALVTVLDQKDEVAFSKETLATLKRENVKSVFGKESFHKLDGYDMLVRSPGIKRNLPEFLAAEKAGVLITSQTQLFFDFCPGKIIGVTGTKGKGTTSSLIHEMLKKAGKDTYLGGNIGMPPFEFLDTVTAQSFVVLELSNFQLEDIGKSPAAAKAMAGKPHIAVMLMVTREHLGADTFGTQNYHETIDEYIAAKRNLVRFQTSSDFAILNRDYPASNESDVYTEAKIFQVSREREVIAQGCFVRDKAIWIKREEKEEKLIDVDRILLPGGHNLENVCAAVMAVTLAGARRDAIIEVLETFKGLEHRLELVTEVNGVRFYDDSFSTTPETAIAAIEAFDSPEILLLGGSSKNSDFTELGELLSNNPNIRAIVPIGKEWERIKENVKNFSSATEVLDGPLSMKQAILEASEIARPGDVVILSPACASFDLYSNYKERGEEFKKEVRKLINV